MLAYPAASCGEWLAGRFSAGGAYCPEEKIKLCLLLSDNFNQNPLPSPPVKLTVEDLFPGAKVQMSVRDGHDDFPPHDLPFQMGIPVILTRSVMSVPRDGIVGGDILQPFLIVLMQTGFIIVDEYRRRDVHRIYQDKTLGDAAFLETPLHLRRNVDKSFPGGNVEPQFFSVGFHDFHLPFLGVIFKQPRGDWQAFL